MSSAVISFVVEPIERSLSAARWQTTVPVETSITIALGALTEPGQDGTFACAGVLKASAPRAPRRWPAPRFTG